jgi:PAS domain S-box-containing protein
MHVDQFDQQIKDFSWRVAVLQQRTQELPLAQQELLAESLEELRTALEELQVAQEALRQQNDELVAGRQVVEAERQRYQDLFEFAPEGYLVTDASGTIWEANRAAAGLLNVSQQLLVGKPLALFIVEPERLAFYSELTRLRGENRVQEWQVCLQPRHGAKIDAALTVVTVRDLQGKGVALRICVRNITARKRIEAALRESEERFCLMVEGVKDYTIFMLAPDGRVVSWNSGAESILGYQEAEIIGQYFSCFFTPEDIQSCKPEQELRTAVAEGRTEEEGWHVRKDGTRFWGSGVLTALRDEAGNLCGFSKIMRDMTQYGSVKV